MTLPVLPPYSAENDTCRPRSLSPEIVLPRVPELSRGHFMYMPSAYTSNAERRAQASDHAILPLVRDAVAPAVWRRSSLQVDNPPEARNVNTTVLMGRNQLR